MRLIPGSQPEATRAPRVSLRTRAEYRWLAAAMALTDYLAIVATFGLAYLARFGLTPGGFDFLAVTLLAPPVWIGVFAALRLYSVQRLAPAEEFKRITYGVTIGITAIVAASYWTKADLSRAWVGLCWVGALIVLFAIRRVWRYVVWRSRQRGLFVFRTLIVGVNDEAAHLVTIMRGGAHGFDAIGLVSPTPGAGPVVGAEVEGVPVVGLIRDVPMLLGELQADCVYVVSSAVAPADVRRMTKLARTEGIEVRLSANIPEMLSSRLAAQPIGGIMAFSIWGVRLTGLQAAAKRTFDVAAGAVLGFLLSPILLVIGVSIRATSRGPALYRQVRVGRFGRTFTVYKFRTMVADADDRLEEMRHRNEASAPMFKIAADERLTSVGRFLRRWSLDELPQLVNVLRGDMSLVGPRPPLPSEVAAYDDWHRERLEVRPGMTGLWQVSGRSDLNFDDAVRLDLFYIENWSLAFDCYLLAKTIPAVVTGRGAY